MALREYQTEILVDTLYEVRASGKGVEQLTPSLAVEGGAVTVYGSQNKPVAPPADMFPTRSNFEDLAPFTTLPNYLYLEETTPTVTSAVLSGVKATEVV